MDPQLVERGDSLNVIRILISTMELRLQVFPQGTPQRIAQGSLYLEQIH
jgi:hypothetical protein